jgi:DNA-binding transcriptional ArsR family regulator
MQLDAFEILADPSRRAVVEALRGGERTVSDIVEALAIHQSGVSRHLRILLESGFVKVRPDGPHRYYSLRPGPFRQLDGWLSGYRALWEARLDRLGAAPARKQKARAGPQRKNDERGKAAKERKR